MTLKGIGSVTGLPGSGGGPTLLSLQGGPLTVGCGPAPAPASPSPAPANGKASRMIAICGPTGGVSLASASLQSCLESRLRASLDAAGSLEYVLTWKHWDMELGLPICALRASELRIKDNGYIGLLLPTCTADDSTGRQLHKPKMTHSGTFRHNNKSGTQSHTRLSQVLNHLGRSDLAVSATFRGWMMGFPMAWTQCAPTAMPSCRRSQPNS